MAHAATAELIACELTKEQRGALFALYALGSCSLLSPGYSDDGGGHPMPTGRELFPVGPADVERGEEIARTLSGLALCRETPNGPGYFLEGDRSTLGYILTCATVGFISVGGASPFDKPADGKEVSPGQEACDRIFQAIRTPQEQRPAHYLQNKANPVF